MIRLSFGCSLGLLLGVTLGCQSDLVDDGVDGQAGSSGSGGGGSVVVDSCAAFYEGFEPTADVSFRQDLVPILQTRCNSALCHGGDPDNAQAGLWLGPDPDSEPTEDELSFTYHTLVNIQSTVAPELALVRPGNAAQSYFMRKLDDCHEPDGLECTLDPDVYGAPCGTAMPVLAKQLPDDERDLFRSWIESGAEEN